VFSLRSQTTIFSTDGKGTWCASLLDILTTPSWSEQVHTQPRVGKLPVSRSAGPESREVVTCSREDAQRILEAEAKKTDCIRSSLVCLSFKLTVSGNPSRDLKSQVERETRTILTGSTRASDSLLRLDCGPSYAVLLREVDAADARRLCRRLVNSLEEIDLAGEISVKVDSRVDALVVDLAPQVFARDVITALAPRSRPA
jgi:hypothetical protein